MKAITSNLSFKLENNRIVAQEPNLWEDEKKPGIRCYGKFMGFFAKIFRKTLDIKAFDEKKNPKIWIINKKSYKNWMDKEKQHYGLIANNALTIDLLINAIRESQGTPTLSIPATEKPPKVQKPSGDTTPPKTEKPPNVQKPSGDKTPPKTEKPPEEKMTAEQQQKAQKVEAAKALYRQGVLKQLNSNTSPTVQEKLQINLTPEQVKDLTEAFESRHQLSGEFSKNDKYTIIGTAGSYVIQLHSLPEVVFKCDRSSEEGFSKNERDTTIKIYDEAREICLTNNLHHLCIPLCISYEIPNTSIGFLVQQKMPTKGNFQFQKGLYLYTQDDPHLNQFAKIILKELSIFIAKQGFRDVKFDNIPILEDGSSVALYDLLDPASLDELDGFFKGGAPKGHDGILNYAPDLEFLNELHTIIGEALKSNAEKLNNFEMRWNKEKAAIQTRIQKRIEKRAKIKAYLQSQNISSPFQLIEGKVKFSDNPIIKRTQQILMKVINQQLTSGNFDLGLARRVKIDYRTIWWSEHESKPGELNDSLFKWTQDLKQAVQELKDQNLIHNFHIIAPYYKLIIRC